MSKQFQVDKSFGRTDRHTHRCTETTINLKYREFAQVLGVSGGGKFGVRQYLVFGRRFDVVPVPVKREALCKSAEKRSHSVLPTMHKVRISVPDSEYIIEKKTAFLHQTPIRQTNQLNMS
jgi:hypothetical protein